MRWFVSIALVAVGSLAVVAAEKTDAAKDEAALWQGTWRAVSFEHDGKQTPSEKLKPIKLTVEGTNYTFENGDFKESGTYKFDPSQKPKALDIVVGGGADKGKVYLVIYKVDGDELTICLESENKHRPTEFTGKEGSGCVLEVWRREKPAAAN
jgi:uncharacterized protein (TIGR03067 family)